LSGRNCCKWWCYWQLFVCSVHLNPEVHGPFSGKQYVMCVYAGHSSISIHMWSFHAIPRHAAPCCTTRLSFQGQHNTVWHSMEHIHTITLVCHAVLHRIRTVLDCLCECSITSQMIHSLQMWRSWYNLLFGV